MSRTKLIGLLVLVAILLPAGQLCACQRPSQSQKPVEEGPVSALELEIAAEPPGIFGLFDLDIDCSLGCDKSSDCGLATKCTARCDDCPTPKFADSCDHLAGVLAEQLTANKMDRASAEKLIGSVMRLIARNAELAGKARIAQIEAAKEQEMAALRAEVVRLSAQAGFVADLQQWLGPLYSNQNRSLQQMQLLASGSSALHRTLSLLEAHLDRANQIEPQLVKNEHAKNTRIREAAVDRRHGSFAGSDMPTIISPPKSRSILTDRQRPDELNELRQQVQQLRRELENLRDSHILPASHLQPIYQSKNQLSPLILNDLDESTDRR
jgi:hypothetical protein